MKIIDRTTIRQRKRLALFKVVDGDKAYHFSDKQAAKAQRDKLPGAVVMRGPDHWKGESFNTSKGR